MTRTPPYAELVAAVRREGETLLTAASMGLDAPVPTCGEWTVADLVRHVSGVYLRATTFVETRATERPEQIPDLPAGEPIDVLRDILDELVVAFNECEPDTPIWTWVFRVPGDAAFWARRMAHESSVHRFDAQNAHGVRQPIDAELAADGLDEFLDVIAPRVYSREGVSGPTGTVALRPSDGDPTYLELTEGGVQRLEVLAEPRASVAGTSSALLLAVCGRMPWPSLDVTGDVALLEAWSQALQF